MQILTIEQQVNARTAGYVAACLGYDIADNPHDHADIIRRTEWTVGYCDGLLKASEACKRTNEILDAYFEGKHHKTNRKSKIK